MVGPETIQTGDANDPQLATLLAELDRADARFAARYGAPPARRQPVHTVYGGAHLYAADTAAKLGAVASQMLELYAPDGGALAGALGLPGDGALHAAIHARVADKLRRQPVEDFRIDFEDGYGNRPDEEEDEHARAAAREVGRGMREGSLPPHVGIRVKPLTPELRERSLRTLDLFLTTLVGESDALPDGFVVTLPKVVVPEQSAFFAAMLERTERRLGLAAGSLVFELMVETPQLVIGADGRCALPAVVDAAGGRAVAAHFGTYDYTASLEIVAAHQRMRHPACDFARQAMQVALAGTGVLLSDGSTTVLPVPPHRPAAGTALDSRAAAENARVVHAAWKLHYDDVTDSLVRGFYQGWDLHPGQLVTRYAAVYAFFLAQLDAAGARLHNFVSKAAQATLVGDVFDDAATGQALLNFFLRAIASGVVSEEETLARTGLALDELRGRSFLEILKRRRE